MEGDWGTWTALLVVGRVWVGGVWVKMEYSSCDDEDFAFEASALSLFLGIPG